MDKQEQKDKKNIEKRLRWSNKKMWANLSADERKAAVDKYYNFFSIDNLGIHQVLENNRNLRINLTSIIMGVMLGIFGSIFSTILLKYLPSGALFDLLVIIGFFIFLAVLVKWIDKISAENLGADKVLEHLVKLTRKDQKRNRQGD